MKNALQDSFKNITQKIRETLLQSGRSDRPIKLLAVSKGQKAESIRELITFGQMDFGENYAQEWKKKREEGLEGVLWHFIGRLQSNKVKDLVGAITLFHSIDRLKVAQAIEEASQRQNIVSRGLIEVDLAHEEAKGGIPENQLETLLKDLNPLTHLEIKGLMILPPLNEDPEMSRPYFKHLREILFDLNRKSIYRSPLTELSMGMSHDYGVAIEEGATWVRIGTALFGEREEVTGDR